MAASYPASLPVKDPAGANLSTNPHSTLHDGMYDEIVAIATELGTTPKGTTASVKARLDLLEIGAWTTWTPIVTQSVGVTVTNTLSRYARYGRAIIATFNLVVTSSGTGSNQITVSLPVTAAAASSGGGSGVITDTGTAIYSGYWSLNSTTTAHLLCHAETAPAGSDPNFALVSGDSMNGTIMYEAAS